MTKVLPPQCVRWVVKDDLSLLVGIENKVHAYHDEDFDCQTTRTTAWDEKDFCLFIREHNNYARVQENDKGVIIGFMVYEMSGDTIEIHKLVVDPEHRRQGYGTAMMVPLHKKLTVPDTDKKQIVMHVREEDRETQEFLKALTFKSCLVRRYFDDGNDAYQFTYTLPSP